MSLPDFSGFCILKDGTTRMGPFLLPDQGQDVC